MTTHTFPAGNRASKALPVAVAVERIGPGKLGVRYSVRVELGGHEYDVSIYAVDSARHVTGCWTASGYKPRGQGRALVEQAAREAVLA